MVPMKAAGVFSSPDARAKPWSRPVLRQLVNAFYRGGMAGFRPTPLDLALADNPLAEADSRAVTAAATPPSWTQLDAAAQRYAAAFDEGRRKLASELDARDTPTPPRQQASAA